MRFLSIDMHISIAYDVQCVFKALGHQLDCLTMSGHAWVNGWKPGTTSVVTPDNWRDIDQAMCDRFADAYGKKLDKYDGFVVSYPPAFALLFERFHKPVIVVNCTRYEHPCENRVDWLNKGLRRMIDAGTLVPLANNRYDRDYATRFTQRTWELMPSLCSYMENHSWTGLGNKPVVWSRPHLRLGVGEDESFSILNKYNRADIAKVGAVIHLPYNVSIMSAFEHRAMGVPMFVPSVNCTLDMIADGYPLLSELRFPGGLPDHRGWLKQADWYHWRGVRQFDSLDHLRGMLETTTPEQWRHYHEETLAGYKADVAATLSKWSEILNDLGGTNRVTPTTWAKAQEAEFRGWTNDWSGLTDDRSDVHAGAFSEYSTLPDDLGDVLEIGCGPFTQSRTIINGRRVSRLVLTDPLAERYAKEHPACEYRNGSVRGVLAEVLSCKGEDLPESLNEAFDTVIMVNVLEHVQDADAVMKRAFACLKPGGLFVCGERIHEPGEPYISELDRTLHPIRVRQDFFDRHFADYEQKYRNGGYFIGVKPVGVMA